MRATARSVNRRRSHGGWQDPTGQKAPPIAEAPPESAAEAAHWEGLEETAEFKQLVEGALAFRSPATIFFLAYYFALPLSNGLFPNVMRTEIVGHINLAYLFALSGS